MNLSIIVVNWNSGARLRRCVDALPAACGSSLQYEVFVVDNASEDGSVAQAQKSPQPFALLALDRNVGFAAANNIALKRARGDILLLLNPDTEPQVGSLKTLVDFFSENPRAGVVGAKLLNPEGTIQRSVRTFPSVGVLAALFLRLPRVFPELPFYRRYEMASFAYDREASVDQVMGACFAIRRSTLDQVGLLDEGFWIWFEEVDYCARAKRAGWDVMYAPTAEVVHHVATAFRQVSPLRRAWWFARSAVRYARKHAGPLRAFCLALLLPLSLVTALPATLLGLPPGVRPKNRPGSHGIRVGGPWGLAAHAVGDAKTLAVLGTVVIALFLGLFFSAQAGLLLLAAAWIAAGTWVYPWPAFLLLIAVAPLLLLVKATVVFGAVTVLKDMVILTLAAKALHVRGRRVSRNVLVPVLILAAWATLAFARADEHVLGFLRLRDLLLYVPMLLIAVRQVSTPARLRTFLRVFLWVGVLVLLLGAAQWTWFPDSMVLRFDPRRQVWIPRLGSVLAHPNHLGSYLVFLVPLAAALTSVLWRRAKPAARTAGAAEDRVAAPISLPLSVVVLGAGLVAVYATYSRSAWVAVTVSLVGVTVFVATRLSPRRVLGIVLLALIASATALLLPTVRTLARATFDPAYQSNKTRLEIAVGSLADVSDVGAVIGMGLGDTVRLLRRDADIDIYTIAAGGSRNVQVAKAQTFVDNAVIKTWVEQGIVGLVLAGWVAVRVVLVSFRVARGAADELRATGVAMGAILLGLLALWLTLDVPDMFPVNLYFWTFLGLVSGEAGPSREAEEPKSVS